MDSGYKFIMCMVLSMTIGILTLGWLWLFLINYNL